MKLYRIIVKGVIGSLDSGEISQDRAMFLIDAARECLIGNISLIELNGVFKR